MNFLKININGDVPTLIKVKTIEEAVNVSQNYIFDNNIKKSEWNADVYNDEGKKVAQIMYDGTILKDEHVIYFDTKKMAIALFFIEWGFFPESEKHRINTALTPLNVATKVQEIKKQALQESELTFNYKYDPHDFSSERNNLVKKYASILEEKYKSQLYHEVVLTIYDLIE